MSVGGCLQVLADIEIAQSMQKEKAAESKPVRHSYISLLMCANQLVLSC